MTRAHSNCKRVESREWTAEESTVPLLNARRSGALQFFSIFSFLLSPASSEKAAPEGGLFTTHSDLNLQGPKAHRAPQARAVPASSATRAIGERFSRSWILTLLSFRGDMSRGSCGLRKRLRVAGAKLREKSLAKARRSRNPQLATRQVCRTFRRRRCLRRGRCGFCPWPD